MSGRLLYLGGVFAMLAYTEVSGILPSLGFNSFFARSALYATVSIVSLVVMLVLFDYEEWRGGGVFGLINNSDQLLSKDKVQNHVDTYESHFGGERRSDEALLESRKKNYTTIVNNFYDLVTDFYEYGWGDSFHFAKRYITETFMESIRRSEHFLAAKLQAAPGKTFVDLGCGVGGPARSIAGFSGCNVIGINNNDYQIKVARKHNARVGLDKNIDFLKCDFMHIPKPDGYFDGAYAVEALCHSPDRPTLFKEIYRIVKPGGYFAAYDWVMTDKYDESNPKHKHLREALEWGNGLPRLTTVKQTVQALKDAGFEVIENFDTLEDTHSKYQLPWYAPLAGEFSLKGFRHHPIGRNVTNIMCATLEMLHIAPKGTTKVAKLLHKTAEDLVESGQLEIFTPDYFWLVRKPTKA